MSYDHFTGKDEGILITSNQPIAANENNFTVIMFLLLMLSVSACFLFPTASNALISLSVALLFVALEGTKLHFL